MQKNPPCCLQQQWRHRSVGSSDDRRRYSDIRFRGNDKYKRCGYSAETASGRRCKNIRSRRIKSDKCGSGCATNRKRSVIRDKAN